MYQCKTPISKNAERRSSWATTSSKSDPVIFASNSKLGPQRFLPVSFPRTMRSARLLLFKTAGLVKEILVEVRRTSRSPLRAIPFDGHRPAKSSCGHASVQARHSPRGLLLLPLLLLLLLLPLLLLLLLPLLLLHCCCCTAAAAAAATAATPDPNAQTSSVQRPRPASTSISCIAPDSTTEPSSGMSPRRGGTSTWDFHSENIMLLVDKVRICYMYDVGCERRCCVGQFKLPRSPENLKFRPHPRSTGP